MPLDIPTIITAKKAISVPPDWVKDRETLELVAPLEIDGVTVLGLQLRGNALLRYADRDVVFQVEYIHRRSKYDPLCRIDWRPRGAHDNKGLGPKRLRFKKINGSHIHAFDLNWNKSDGRFEGRNLPVADALDSDPQDFVSLLAIVSKAFRISNMGVVPVPPWESLLL